MPLLSHMELRTEKRGSLKIARESVLENLDVRFGEVPSEIVEAVNAIEDLSRLRQRRRQSITIGSLAAFQPLLSSYGSDVQDEQ